MSQQPVPKNDPVEDEESDEYDEVEVSAAYDTSEKIHLIVVHVAYVGHRRG